MKLRFWENDRGWECPRCNQVWAPHVNSCYCPAHSYNYTTGANTSVNWSDTTFTFAIPPDEPTGTPV